MANHNQALPHLRWLLSSVLMCSSAVGLVTMMATTSGCAKEPSVSSEPPAPDADMKKVIINVFGMT